MAHPAPDHDATGPETGRSGLVPDGPSEARTSAEDRKIMRARLAAMAAPRDSDTPRTAALRAALRDEQLMAYVCANVDLWPPITEEQRDTLAAILNRPANRPPRRAA